MAAASGKPLPLTVEVLDPPPPGPGHVDARGIVRVTKAEVVEENVMGIRLPKLGNLEIKVSEYPFLGKPHWVDRVVQLLHVSAIENADVGVLSSDAPKVTPNPRPLQFLRPLALDLFEFIGGRCGHVVR